MAIYKVEIETTQKLIYAIETNLGADQLKVAIKDFEGGPIDDNSEIYKSFTSPIISLEEDKKVVVVTA